MTRFINGVFQDRSGNWSVFIYDFDEKGNEFEMCVGEDELLEYLDDIKQAKAGKIAIRK